MCKREEEGEEGKEDPYWPEAVGTTDFVREIEEGGVEEGRREEREGEGGGQQGRRKEEGRRTKEEGGFWLWCSIR
jgi:hypothetical protein